MTRNDTAARIIAVCGKICCGKSFYTDKLKNELNAVVLSCDELTHVLFDNDLGDGHDAMMLRVKRYFHKKAAEIVRSGCNVILEWGFWSHADRAEVTALYREQGIEIEWHYIDISDEDWQKNIAARNAAVRAGDNSVFELDEGLMKKLLSLFEPPTHDEIDVWYINRRA